MSDNDLEMQGGAGGRVSFAAPRKPITIQPGLGGVPDGKDGPIVFKLADETEVVRFDGDGCIYIRGEKVDDNLVVYKAFHEWLRSVVRV